MSLKQLLKIVGLGALAAAALGAGACRRATDRGALTAAAAHPADKTLRAFGSEAELTAFLRELANEQQRQRAQAYPGYGQPGAPPPPMQAPSPEPESAEPATASAADGEDSVTNVQHAGVDEGGIVKLHGDHLVGLRRGRLFTIEIAGGELQPISAVDAFGPDVDPSGTWYDEMLIANDTIAVIGYSYERGGTEIGLFDINRAGRLRYRATYHLRSNDYYSSRNYASRLIGDKLVFYAPLHLSLRGDDLFRSFPALRKWRRGAEDGDFRRIASATRVYRPLSRVHASSGLGLHTVTVCDLARRDLDCQATVVLGPPGHVFYVSPGSVYVWASDWHDDETRNRPKSLLYRLPLDGSGPSVLRVAGSPVDQFSFLESGDGRLNVLVRSDAAGDGMWAAEATDGAVALLRVPLESFSDGDSAAPRSSYRILPKPEGYTFQNRFVGDYVLYGTGSGWGAPEERSRGALFAYRYASGGDAVKLSLAHGVDRIEALGQNAVVVGTDGKDLHFSPVALGSQPTLARRYTRQNASQGELRSHGFFYKPDGATSGLLGLPIREAGRPGYEHLFHESASILFLRNSALSLSELGALGARPEGAVDDGCRASCVDWYGNARPLFAKGRVFALLGYEIVEGSIDRGRIRETRRASFAPAARRIAR